MKRKYFIMIAILLLVLVTACTQTGYVVKEQQIKIGVIAPFSGDGASYGEGWRKGAELAKEKIEAEFGEGVIELIYEDSKLNPAEAVTSTQKLIAYDGVKAIVIAVSSETLAIAPITEENNILLMTGGTNADITDAGEYVFRIYPSDLYQGKDLADTILNQGYDEIAVLTVQDNYGIGLTNTFESRVEEIGKSLSIVEKFVPETVDFKTQLNKISTKNPDVLLIIGMDNHYPLILKQMKELNMDLPLFASETFQSQTILDNAGDLSEGVIFTTFVESETEEYLNYVSNHKNKYDSEPFVFSAGFYDNILLVSEALIKNNGDIDEAKDWLYNIKDWNGATGITNYDVNGDTVGKSFTLMTVKNGEFVEYN